MAYAITTVSDLAAIITFIRNTCTANGWTLANNVLYRAGCYVEIVADGSIGIRIRGGTAIDGSNNLAGSLAPQYAYWGTIATIPLTFPATLEAHVNTAPDEVYFVINYSVSYYSLLAFGQSDVPGITGTGCWFHANRSQTQGAREYTSSAGGVDLYTNFGDHPDGFPMFSGYRGHAGNSSNGATNSYIHGDLDGGGWNATPDASAFPNSNIFVSPLLDYQPNLWNGEAVLIPFPIYMFRTAGAKCSLLGDLKHIRHTRLDYVEPGTVIVLGTDKWKIYPWFRKNAATPDGGSGSTHSGTIGYAVRYTGT